MAVVKRVGIFSVGKVLGALYAIAGLIAGGLISLSSLAGASAGGSTEGIVRAIIGGGAALGLAAIVIIPLLYAAGGFISGIIMAALYNLIASWIGGVEVEIDSDSSLSVISE